ncbi:HEAT repeat domain-containing protein [Streptomyces sp. PSRA5]|uniref:HEAT repeat domain-containing protein n=1 Tax=Streptomyces panacea TaxID=3035064 RepID=UPI00339BD9BB
MDLAQIFADLDAQPWAEREHAYGSADDLPDQLRALASDDAEESEEALYELYGNIVHQGSVYEATAHAVPYPARLAAAGIRPADMLLLLGCIAESEDERSDTPGACRAAVAAQLPLILPLIESPDTSVRQAAVWAAARTGAAEQVLPVLRRCWEGELDPVVRAEVLAGTVLLDPAGAREFETAVLGTPGDDGEGGGDGAEGAPVRLAALLACVDADLPWTAAHHDTLISLLPLEPLVASRFDMEQNEPLRYVVEGLLDRDTDEAREAAFTLADAGLRHPDADARGEAVSAAEHACEVSRAAPARLAGPLAALLGDPSSASPALSVVRQLGAYAAPAVPALTALATEGGELADRALAALVGVVPETAAPLLAADLSQRPKALDAAAKTRPGGWDGAAREGDPDPFPCVPELLDAVRARLADSDIAWNESIHLGLLLAGWGQRAAPAVPDLLAALDRYPFVVLRALPAICPPEERDRVAAALHAADLTEQSPLDVGSALHRLTGETGPLVKAVTEALVSGDRDVADAAKLAGELGGSEASALLPYLRAALSDTARKPRGSSEEGRTNPRLDGDTEIARALWRLTGSADEALPILAGVLEEADGDWTRWQNVRAAGAAGALGELGRPLAPLLARKLDHPDHAAAAALALLTVDPTGQDHTRLADAALTSAETNADPQSALDFLRAFGARNLTAHQLTRLTDLAERDAHVFIPGFSQDPVRADARFREEARALLRESENPARGVSAT